MSDLITSRRAFLGLAAGLTTATVTGCGASTAAAPGTPSAGGRLRAAFAGGGAQEVLDPHKANLFVEIARSKAMYDKLADYADDVSIVPRLAERWEPSKDLRTWRISLRKATFHDGRPVRAEDVLYSYRRILDPAGSLRAKASLGLIDIAHSRAVDPVSVEFRLLRPFVEFPNVLAALGAYIIPAGTTSFDKPVGSGPFAFESFTPGRVTSVRRFDGHWDGTAHMDGVDFVLSNEESARTSALAGGQVEYAHDLSPATARSYQRHDRIAMTMLPNSTMQAFAMKVDRKPFDNPDLRTAMFLLCDRQQLVDGAIGGAGTVGNDLFGRGFQYYADSIPQRQRDLEQARALVRKAGAEGLQIPLDTSAAGTGFLEAASIFAKQAKEVGLDVRPVVRNKETYWKDILDTGVLACYRSGAMPIETHISQRLLTGSTTNATKWERADFDTMYDRTVETADPVARAQRYTEMQQLLHAEGGFLVWGFADWVIGTSKKVGGVTRSPANTLDWARFDKVWLA